MIDNTLQGYTGKFWIVMWVVRICNWSIEHDTMEKANLPAQDQVHLGVDAESARIVKYFHCSVVRVLLGVPQKFLIHTDDTYCYSGGPFFW